MSAAQGHSLPQRTVAWISLGVGLTMIPLLSYLPLWIALLGGVALLVRLALSARGKHLRHRWLLPAGAIAGAFAVYAYHGTLSGRDAGVTLLMLMLSMKTLEMSDQRDAMLVIFLTFFLMLTGFFYTQSIPLALYISLILVFETACMIDVHQGPGGPVTRRKLGIAAWMLARSIPLMVIMFLLFPRLSGPLWSVFDDSSTGVSGLSDEMSPGKISQLILSNETAFRVTFEGEPPPPEDRYWRGAVMWRYDGRTWRQRFAPQALPSQPVTDGELIRYTVALQPHDKDWLFALETPVGAPDDANINGDYQVVANQPVTKVRTYSLSSSPSYRKDAPLTKRDRALALSLPEAGAARARQLAVEWRQASRSDREVVSKALAHFAEQAFVYTLTPPVLQTDPVDEFLFATRRGFCEHYASSFVVLMRAAGIPARIVVGYLGGEWNPLGSYLQVRQADAHAWSEVWLEGRGWVRVDPTGAVSPERVELGIDNTIAENQALPFLTRIGYTSFWLHRLSQVWDSANFHWNEWVVAFDPARQLALMQRLGFENASKRTLLVAMVTGLAAIIALYAVLSFWRRPTNAPDVVALIYERFCLKLSTAGMPRPACEGPHDYAARIMAERPDLAESVRGITRLYTQLRYGRESRDSDVPRLRKMVKELKV